jgi:hypothetical protein
MSRVKVQIDGEKTGFTPLSVDLSGHAAELMQIVLSVEPATAYRPQAVKWHLGRLMRRWNAANRSALVAVAFRRGLLITATTTWESASGAGALRRWVA